MPSTRPPVQAPDHRSEHRPPWLVLLGAPGASLTRPSRSLKPRVTHAHAVTTPLESRGSPACLAVVFTVAVAAGMSPPATGEPSLALSLDDLAAFPRIRRSVHAPPRRFTMTVDTSPIPPSSSEGRRRGQSHRRPWGTPQPAQHARWGVVSPTRTTELAYAAAPHHYRTPVELEPPLAVASTLGKLWPPL